MHDTIKPQRVVHADKKPIKGIIELFYISSRGKTLNKLIELDRNLNEIRSIAFISLSEWKKILKTNPRLFM